MSRRAYLYPLLLGCLLGAAACSSASNDATAVLERQPGAQYLQLTGRRVYMAHDPISAIFNGTYKDTVHFQLPAQANGVIPGYLIPHKHGYYAYLGTIRLQPERKKVTVRLACDNYDDHTRDSLFWNGEYDLVIHEGTVQQKQRLASHKDNNPPFPERHKSAWH